MLLNLKKQQKLIMSSKFRTQTVSRTHFLLHSRKMGCWSSSANSLTNTPTNFPFFMIDFSDRHVLNIMLADCRAVSVVSSAVAKMWSSGVEQETRLGRGYYEIRFFDNLFEREAYHVCCILLKRVMCKIFMDLYQIGWQPLVASSLTVHSKLSTWFFYKLKYKTVPKAAVLAIYLYGFSQEMTYGDDYEIKLKGKPWNSCVFDENVTAKRLILEIVRLFSQSGYQLYNTSNMTGSTCCMFFVQRRSIRILKHVEYFLIQLYYSNQIRLIGATDQNVQDVQKALEASCTFSFEKKDLLITTQFTLNARLWSTSRTKHTKMTSCNSSKNEFEDMNTFLCKFFENLSSLGWRIVSSLSASQHLDDKCLFVLRSCEPSSIKHCMINLSDKNQLNVPISEHYAEIKKILKSFGIGETIVGFNSSIA
uniref:Uncharacterized protein n=1 Tax=Romanomermis culicivorax TaxID=13658 RepID=A0A915HTM4_ROMCU